MVAGSLGRARLGRVRLTPVLAGGLACVLACYLAALGYGAARCWPPLSIWRRRPWAWWRSKDAA